MAKVKVEVIKPGLHIKGAGDKLEQAKVGSIIDWPEDKVIKSKMRVMASGKKLETAKKD